MSADQSEAAPAAPSNTVTPSPAPVSALGKRQRGSSPAGSDSYPNNLLETLVHTVDSNGDVYGEVLKCMEDGRGICILSAEGSISQVMLTPINARGACQYYTAAYEILTLSGFFLPSADAPVGGINALLADCDGSVIGGTVVYGLLEAYSPVQLLLGIFDVEEKSSSGAPLTSPTNIGSSSSGAPPKLPKLKLDGAGARSSTSQQGSGCLV